MMKFFDFYCHLQKGKGTNHPLKPDKICIGEIRPPQAMK